ncbi:MAG TPA: hypothetical protein VNU97_19245 [Rhizomicrobium sp.]|jgi:hypothetical protein|nr:hypothetical protein [Rhizomicrobium sp.]
MAAKTKKKAARKAATAYKRPAKAAARKTATRKKPAAKAAPKAKARKKSWIARAVSDMGGLLTGRKAKAKKQPASGEFGEGNYKASKRFRDREEAFVKTNRKKIPALGKAAEAALEGPEGDDLRAAEAAAGRHAAGAKPR